ncbi:glycoside hydrolase domain-containing protein [Streptomyces boninensis]|uniref:glycoside hydrolase domain-containing protein n=1 Tax=Streptomyces boninensis TaxID=2039455 RepID=UPI003B228B08
MHGTVTAPRRTLVIAAACAALAGLAPASGERAAAAGPEPFQGEAFDTCSAPPLDTMRAWRASPYRAVGIYYAGRGRHCQEQPQLTPYWLREVDRMGWRVLPVYVGSQPPCIKGAKKAVRMHGEAGKAAKAGRSEGRDAVAKAKLLGMAKGSPLFLDIEAFSYKDAKCRAATLEFVRAWNREVQQRGWLAGFYSSASSGVRMVEAARRAGQDGMPEVMWFARWHVGPSLHDEPQLAKDAWQPHRRVHQHEGNVEETHGGKTLMIDRNVVDAPTAVLK